MPNFLRGWIALLLALLQALRDWLRGHRNLAVRLNLAVRVGGTIHGATHMDLTLDQLLPLAIAPTDAKDRPASVKDIVWTASAPGLVVAADGLSAVFTPEASGDVVVQVAANDLEGTVIAPETLTLTVKAGVAVKLNLTAGTPAPKP